jgi:hypothetical protein
MKGFIKPKDVLLPESAAIPERNLISPAPNQFTHELIRSLPFYFTAAKQSSSPDGELLAGTKVSLLKYDGGAYCHVADGQGLYVEVEHDGLKKL